MSTGLRGQLAPKGLHFNPSDFFISDKYATILTVVSYPKYIMPGYLFGYKKFKNEYETPIVKDNSEKAMKKLKMLIEPFVLRRTKKQVLTELPEKTITVLNNQMKEEQEKIYLN